MRGGWERERVPPLISELNVLKVSNKTTDLHSKTPSNNCATIPIHFASQPSWSLALALTQEGRAHFSIAEAMPDSITMSMAQCCKHAVAHRRQIGPARRDYDEATGRHFCIFVSVWSHHSDFWTFSSSRVNSHGSREYPVSREVRGSSGVICRSSLKLKFS